MKVLKKIVVFFLSIVFILNINKLSFANSQSESEINEIINNKDNWILGYYQSWGGSFKESTSSYCLKEAVYIEPGSYYIVINDSRFQLSIHQFDENGKWINNYKDGLSDGKTIDIAENTSYIKINISSKVWGVNPIDYFGYGLSVNIMSEYTPQIIEKINLVDADLKNISNVKSGMITSQTGKPALDLNKVYFNNYYIVDDTKYVVNLANPNVRMQILEFDDQDKIIVNNTLPSGKAWQKQESTSYIAINIFNNKKDSNYVYENYIEELSTYSKACLTKYEKYNHNTSFNTEFKAYDFAKTMNVGWNLGDALGSGYCTEVGEDANLMLECSWGNPYITEDLIDIVANQGFNTIRMPVTWFPNCGTDENGHLVIGKEWISRVQDVVDYAIKNDMYVIINTMGDADKLFYVGVEDAEEWNKVLQNGADIWSQVAEYFKDYDEHLIFESYNEIGTKTGWTYSKLATNQINELNQVFTNAVRKTGGNNKYRLLTVPTYTTSSKENITADFKLPEDEETGRIMISVHVYNAMYDEDIEWKFQSLEDFSIRLDAPIIIGEFGMNSKSQLQELRATHMSNYLARATAHGLKCCVWDDNYNWQLIDRWNYSNIKTDLINAMFQGFNEGIAYRTTKNKFYYNNINQFHIGGVNLGNGEIWNTDYSTAWWGGLVPLNDTRTSTKIKIPENTDYVSFNIKTTQEAAEVWIVGAVWFDKDGNYLTYSKSQEITSRYKLIKVPEGAEYFSAGFHDPYVNHNVSEYGKWLKEEKISLDITYINQEDFGLEQEIVNVSNYDYSNRILKETVVNKKREILDDCDLNNIYNWVSGFYLSSDGQYKASSNKICLKEHKTVVPGTEYNVKISDEEYKISIVELDNDFNFKEAHSNLSDGDTYIVSDSTKYIGLYLFKNETNDIKYSDYRNLFINDEFSIELEKISNNIPEEVENPTDEDKEEPPIEEPKPPADEEPKDEQPTEEEKLPVEEDKKEEQPIEEPKLPVDEEQEEEKPPVQEDNKEDKPIEEPIPPADEGEKDEQTIEETPPLEDNKKENEPIEEEQTQSDTDKERNEQASNTINNTSSNTIKSDNSNNNTIKNESTNSNTVKRENIQSNTDNTVAKNSIPSAGTSRTTLGFLIMAIISSIYIFIKK